VVWPGLRVTLIGTTKLGEPEESEFVNGNIDALSSIHLTAELL
jgi:hypothetical protein